MRLCHMTQLAQGLRMNFDREGSFAEAQDTVQ